MTPILSAARKGGLRLVLIAAAATLAVLASAAQASAAPSLTTDKGDYPPGEVVHVSGAGFEPGVEYALPVQRPDGSIVKGDGSNTRGWDKVRADESGNLAYDYQLNAIIGEYEVRAYPAGWSGDWGESPITSVTFFDAANLDQCGNGTVLAPIACAGSGWQNGNLNANQAHYVEGDSVP